jgi:hypothetical protein
MTLGTPARLDDLPAAIREGIRTCTRVFAQGPARGPKGNFGLAALLKWANSIADVKDKKSWPHVFPPGPYLVQALTAVFEAIETQGAGGAARGLYADFLDEASAVLGQPELKDIAAQFRANAGRWSALANALLPDTVAPLKEMRELLLRRTRLFIEHGMETIEERQQITARLQAIQAEAATGFPMTDAAVAAFREELRERILELHDAEKEAVLALQSAIS